jgi:nickel-dependent lactate racemase
MGIQNRLSWETIAPLLPSGRRRPPVELLGEAWRTCPALEPFLGAAAAAGEPILLLVNDSHRSTQTRAALLALAGFLSGRFQTLRFRAVVATGVHRFSAAERRAFELATLAGTGLKVEDVVWHDADAADSLADLAGQRLNRRLAESRFLLPIGSVEPHYFAGVSGAHKTVTIGCLDRTGIERNHAGALQPAAEILCLSGNPVFDGIAAMLQGLHQAGKRICAINQVVRGGEIVAAVAGDPLETLDTLLPLVRRLYLRTVERPADLLHVRVPPPLGRNLYQADKALKNNHRAVRDGGGILLEADCSEGIGPDAFLSLLRRAGDYATACRIVAQEGYHLGDHKAVKLRQLTDPAQRGVRVALVSRNIAVEDAEAAGMSVFTHVESASQWLAAEIPDTLERGLVVEDAGFVSVAVAT